MHFYGDTFKLQHFRIYRKATLVSIGAIVEKFLYASFTLIGTEENKAKSFYSMLRLFRVQVASIHTSGRNVCKKEQF